MDAKTKAIVAHLTLIGWIIAFVLNNSEKHELASYYLRQMIGIWLLSIAGMVLAMIPIPGIYYVSLIIYLAVFVFWIISLIGALSGEAKPLPLVGDQFQDWFKGIG